MQPYQQRERQFLGRYHQLGQLRYKDETAYWCGPCGATINVICPVCKFRSERHHGETTFLRLNVDYQRWDGYTWVAVECPKCDYRFKVIYRA